MKLFLLLALFAISFAFAFLNSFSETRENLYPAAAIFLMLGGSLMAGPGIQIQNGTELQYQEINNETLIAEKTPVYQEVSSPVQGIDISFLIGLIFTTMAAAYIIMAGPGRFRTLISSR